MRISPCISLPIVERKGTYSEWLNREEMKHFLNDTVKINKDHLCNFM